MTIDKVCEPCGTTPEKWQGQWWSLKNYYGFSGWFCPDCYNKVSHNSYGKPDNPQAYLMMLLKKDH